MQNSRFWWAVAIAAIIGLGWVIYELATASNPFPPGDTSIERETADGYHNIAFDPLTVGIHYDPQEDTIHIQGSLEAAFRCAYGLLCKNPDMSGMTKIVYDPNQ